MSIKVLVQNKLEPGLSREILLPEPVATLGRQKDCSIVLDDPAKHVSRVHATIRAADGRYFLEVASSVNPVLVDGAKCEAGASVPLKDGSLIRIPPFKLTVAIVGGKGGAFRPSNMGVEDAPPTVPVPSRSSPSRSAPKLPPALERLAHAPEDKSESSLLSLMRTNLVPLRVPEDDSTPITELDAFLKGLGARELAISPMDPVVFFERAGMLVRTFTAGLISLMLAQSEVKHQLNMADRREMTGQRNPLKLMTDATEAVYYLFDPDSDASREFLKPQKAVEHVYENLVAHEVAVLAGIRAAFEGAVERLNPAILEDELERQGGMALNRKARLWDLYLDEFKKLEEQMTQNLNRLFHTDFLGAYSAEIRRQNKS